MFGALRRAFSPAPVNSLPAGVSAEIGRQMIAIARMADLDLRNKQVFDRALMVATIGVRLGIDFESDPKAPAKFMACIEIMGKLQSQGYNAGDPAVLDLMAQALRQI